MTRPLLTAAELRVLHYATVKARADVAWIARPCDETAAAQSLAVRALHDALSAMTAAEIARWHAAGRPEQWPPPPGELEAENDELREAAYPDWRTCLRKYP